MYIQESKQIISKLLSKAKDKNIGNKIKNSVITNVKNPAETSYVTRNYVKRLKEMKNKCEDEECEEKIDKKIKTLNIAINSGRVIKNSVKIASKLYLGV